MKEAPPPRILELAAKLKRLIESPSATQGERQAARSRLEAVLSRYKLTLEQVTEETVYERGWLCDYDWELDLLLQVVGHVTNAPKVAFSRHRRYLNAQAKRKNPGIKGWAVKIDLNATDWIDVSECYSYYHAMLETEQEDASRKRKELLKRARKMAALTTEAFFQKFRIYAENEGDEIAPELSKEQIEHLRAVLALADSMEGERWQRTRKMESRNLELSYRG